MSFCALLLQLSGFESHFGGKLPVRFPFFHFWYLRGKPRKSIGRDFFLSMRNFFKFTPFLKCPFFQTILPRSHLDTKKLSFHPSEIQLKVLQNEYFSRMNIFSYCRAFFPTFSTFLVEFAEGNINL